MARHKVSRKSHRAIDEQVVCVRPRRDGRAVGKPLTQKHPDWWPHTARQIATVLAGD